jgi:hypothetical protein
MIAILGEPAFGGLFALMAYGIFCGAQKNSQRARLAVWFLAQN